MLFGSENTASVVDSLTHLSLIRIPMPIWQYCVAEVTPLTSAEIFASFTEGKALSRGTHSSRRLAESAPSSVQMALVRLSFSSMDSKETNGHFFLFTRIASCSRSLGKDKMTWAVQLSRLQISLLSGKKRCRVAERRLCVLRQIDHKHQY